MDLLEQELADQNTEELRRLAHRLKGSAANVSATPMAQAARRVEVLAEAGKLEEIPPQLTSLRSEWRRFQDDVASVYD